MTNKSAVLRSDKIMVDSDGNLKVYIIATNLWLSFPDNLLIIMHKILQKNCIQYHGSHRGGGKCHRFQEKKNPLRQSQGGAGPARRATWSLHFVHNLCLV